MKKAIAYSVFILCFISCTRSKNNGNIDATDKEPIKQNDEKSSWLSQVEQAHKKDLFLKEKNIRYTINVSFGGKKRLNATIVSNTNSQNAFIKTDAGDSIYINNNLVYYNIKEKEVSKIRFDAYTWNYFFLLSYKLGDKGTNLSNYTSNKLNGSSYSTKKLTFNPTIGDAPNDWYVLYANTKTKLLEVAAYIVTANKSVEEAEKDPHAIKYQDYKLIQNIPIATKWSFWSWNEKEGLTNPLGEASISNIEFVKMEDSFYDAPNHFILSK